MARIPASAPVDTASAAQRPWDRSAKSLDALSVVGTVEGSMHRSTMHWIPGVVLIAVDAPAKIDSAVEDLREALGTSGLSFGLLMLVPGVRWASRPDAATLARMRIQVVPAHDPEIDPDHPHLDRLNELAKRKLKRMGEESRERLVHRIERPHRRQRPETV